MLYSRKYGERELGRVSRALQRNLTRLTPTSHTFQLISRYRPPSSFTITLPAALYAVVILYIDTEIPSDAASTFYNSRGGRITMRLRA